MTNEPLRWTYCSGPHDSLDFLKQGEPIKQKNTQAWLCSLDAVITGDPTPIILERSWSLAQIEPPAYSFGDYTQQVLGSKGRKELTRTAWLIEACKTDRPQSHLWLVDIARRRYDCNTERGHAQAFVARLFDHAERLVLRCAYYSYYHEACIYTSDYEGRGESDAEKQLYAPNGFQNPVADLLFEKFLWGTERLLPTEREA